MTIGTGLVLLGVWLVAAAAMFSCYVSGTGVWLAIIVAIIMAVYLK